MLNMVSAANLSHSREYVAVSHVALIYISLMNNDMNVFIYLCVFFSETPQILAMSKIELFISSLKSFQNSLCILHTNPLLKHIFKYFLPVLELHFLYLKRAFCTGNNSHSNEIQCIGFSPFLA